MCELHNILHATNVAMPIPGPIVTEEVSEEGVHSTLLVVLLEEGLQYVQNTWAAFIEWEILPAAMWVGRRGLVSSTMK